MLSKNRKCCHVIKIAYGVQKKTDFNLNFTLMKGMGRFLRIHLAAPLSTLMFFAFLISFLVFFPLAFGFCRFCSL